MVEMEMGRITEWYPFTPVPFLPLCVVGRQFLQSFKLLTKWEADLTTEYNYEERISLPGTTHDTRLLHARATSSNVLNEILMTVSCVRACSLSHSNVPFSAITAGKGH